MSSINSNPPSPTLPYVQQNSATGPAAASQAAGATVPAGQLSPVSDEMAQAIGAGTLDVTQQKPPVPSEARPEGYTQNARGAAEALTPFQGGVSTAYQTALVASESGTDVAGANRQANTLVSATDAKEAEKAAKATETRQKQVSDQAKSILDSTSESEKGGCKTKYTNHDDNVKAMQDCGLSESQAKKLTQLLEDGRTPQDVKDKVAYQLAAIGMTDSGSSKPIAVNADQVRQGLEGLKVTTSGIGSSGITRALGIGSGKPTVDSKALDDMASADLSHARNEASPKTTGGALGNFTSQQLLNPEFAISTTGAGSTSSSTGTSTGSAYGTTTGTSAGSGYGTTTGTSSGTLTPQTESQASIMGSALYGAYGEMRNV